MVLRIAVQGSIANQTDRLWWWGHRAWKVWCRPSSGSCYRRVRLLDGMFMPAICCFRVLNQPGLQITHSRRRDFTWTFSCLPHATSLENRSTFTLLFVPPSFMNYEVTPAGKDSRKNPENNSSQFSYSLKEKDNR